MKLGFSVISISDFREWLTSGPAVSWSSAWRDGRITSIVIHLNELFGDDSGRKTFIKWAFGASSVKELGDRELARLWQWLGPRRDKDTGEWVIREQCQRTAAVVSRALRIEAGQQELL